MKIISLTQEWQGLAEFEPHEGDYLFGWNEYVEAEEALEEVAKRDKRIAELEREVRTLRRELAIAGQ